MWWLPSVKQLPTLANVQVDLPLPHVVEISSQFRAVTGAIKENRWLQLGRMCNEHLIVPTVKCPWGCCEFLNLAVDTVPLDVIYLDFLDYPEQTLKFTAKDKSKFVCGIRPGFLRSRHRIARWSCVPSIIFKDGKGPAIATCQFHSTRSMGRYVHPPRCPFGTTTTGASDQYAPAVIHPRTVASAKRRQYSDRYHLVKMTGRYEGVESFTLCNQGNYGISDCISMKHDALAMSARPDISANIVRLSEDAFIPQSLSDAKHEQAHDMFPSNVLKQIRNQFETDTTYVPIENCLELETFLKVRTECTILVYSEDDDEGQEVQFKPPWPQQVIHIHPTNMHGIQPASVPVITGDQPFTDTRGLWVLLALAVQNPPLWKLIAAEVKNNLQWYGWFLVFATKHCLRCYGNIASRNNPFRQRMKPEELLDKMFGQHHNSFYTSEVSTSILSDLPKVKVVGSETFFLMFCLPNILFSMIQLKSWWSISA